MKRDANDEGGLSSQVDPGGGRRGGLLPLTPPPAPSSTEIFFHSLFATDAAIKLRKQVDVSLEFQKAPSLQGVDLSQYWIVARPTQNLDQLEITCGKKLPDYRKQPRKQPSQPR